MSPAPYPSWCFTLGTPPLHASLACSCWLSARHPYPMLCLWKSYLASKIQIKCQCSCFSIHNLLLPASSYCTLDLWLDLRGHFMLSCISFWLFTPPFPMDCNFLEDGNGLTLSILMVPHTPVRPSFPGHLVKNRIPTTFPVLHLDLFFSIAHVHLT